jgi:hypothetical protein
MFKVSEHEPSSEPLSTPQAHRTANVTCSTAVKLDTKMTRQMQSDSSRDEMLRKTAKYTLFDHKINYNYASDMIIFSNYTLYSLYVSSKALCYVTNHSCLSVCSQC